MHDSAPSSSVKGRPAGCPLEAPDRAERPDLRVEALTVECEDRDGLTAGTFALAVTVTIGGRRWRDVYLYSKNDVSRRYRIAGIDCRVSPFLARQPLAGTPARSKQGDEG